PKGGMGKIIDALESLATQHGVSIQTNAEATQIEVIDGQVVGVKTKNQDFQADVVIGATDIPMVELGLLPPKHRSWDASYWKKKTMGISALLLYLGVDKKYPKLD